MAAQQHIAVSIIDNLRARAATLLSLAIMAAMLTIASSARAQTLTVLHNFSGGQDGALPYAGMVMDRAGNLYGSASAGGSNACPGGCGTVFKLSPHGSSWVFTLLYSFQGGMDGQAPLAPLLIAPDGTLYGTTYAGGAGSCFTDFGHGCGTVFRLRPPAHFCSAISCPWTETVVYRFSGGLDGSNPGEGPLVIDAAGNLYGTASEGGQSGEGAVFKLSPANGGWSESVIHSFTGADGNVPHGGVVFDAAGNLFGTAGSANGTGDGGTVYELSLSGQNWIITVLHTFSPSEGDPEGGLAADATGNFYGVTYNFRGDPGWVYELSNSGQGYQYAPIAMLPTNGGLTGPALDAAGNLYGVEPQGDAYKFTNVNGIWNFSLLYLFDHPHEGSPEGVPLVDGQNNVYGTTINGGTASVGVVWKIVQ